MFKKLIVLAALVVGLNSTAALAQEAPDALVRKNTNEILAAI